MEIKIIQWSCKECGINKFIGFQRLQKIKSILKKIRKSHKTVSPSCRVPVEELKMTIPKMLSVQEVHDKLVKEYGMLAK